VPWRRIARREEGRHWGRGGRDQGKQGRLYAEGPRMCIEVRAGCGWGILAEVRHHEPDKIKDD
jgi:hypothetical protein